MSVGYNRLIRSLPLKRKKIRGALPVAFFFAVVYFIFFPSYLSKEPILKPVWHCNLSEYTTPYFAEIEEEHYYFDMGDRFGYISTEGTLKLLENVLYRVALNDRGFINFSRIPGSLILQSPGGELIRSYRHTGYPVFDKSGNSIFIFYTDSTGFKEITIDDEELWKVQFASLITSFNFSEGIRLVGLLDGRLKVFSDAGMNLYETSTEGSRVPIILGCAGNRSGTKFAVVAGLDPQMLILYQLKGSQFVEERAYNISSDFRREVRIRFSENERYLFFEQPRSLVILDLNSQKFIPITLPGKLLTVDESSNWAVVTLICEANGNALLRQYSINGSLLHEETLPGGDSFVRHIGDRLLLGNSDRLICVDLREE